MVAPGAERILTQSDLSLLADPYPVDQSAAAAVLCQEKHSNLMSEPARHCQSYIKSLQLGLFAGASIQTEAATQALVRPQPHS